MNFGISKYKPKEFHPLFISPYSATPPEFIAFFYYNLAVSNTIAYFSLSKIPRCAIGNRYYHNFFS